MTGYDVALVVRNMMPEQRREMVECCWKLQRDLYIACGPTVPQIKRQAMRLRADSDWLLELAAGLAPAEAALDAEYGPNVCCEERKP